ncbi:Ezrin/radixin/moesin family protein [Cyclobacterium xiamenense]|uniref:SPOR domain-containing protein n=1 Tax=Cyclobacterium xiamenense TaxID=1297121 RepID=UPI0035D01DDF
MNFEKLYVLLFLGLVLVSCSPKTLGGLSKEEYASWKQKKKELSPADYKNLVEEKEQLEEDNRSLAEKEAYLNQLVAEKNDEISRMSEQVLRLRSAQAAAPVEANAETNPWDHGVVFRVQLAALDDYDLRDLTENGSDLKIVDEDGYIKYVLGQFRDYEMADTFKKKLRKIGVKEAWIVPYKDGERVPLKEVLTEAID